MDSGGKIEPKLIGAANEVEEKVPLGVVEPSAADTADQSVGSPAQPESARVEGIETPEALRCRPIGPTRAPDKEEEKEQQADKKPIHDDVGEKPEHTEGENAPVSGQRKLPGHAENDQEEKTLESLAGITVEQAGGEQQADGDQEKSTVDTVETPAGASEEQKDGGTPSKKSKVVTEEAETTPTKVKCEE